MKIQKRHYMLLLLFTGLVFTAVTTLAAPKAKVPSRPPELSCTEPVAGSQYRCNIAIDVAQVSRTDNQLEITGTGNQPVILRLTSVQGRGTEAMDACQLMATESQNNAAEGWYLRGWIYFQVPPPQTTLDQITQNKLIEGIFDRNVTATHPSQVSCAIAGI